jgi:hypothetical protein
VGREASRDGRSPPGASSMTRYTLERIASTSWRRSMLGVVETSRRHRAGVADSQDLNMNSQDLESLLVYHTG